MTTSIEARLTRPALAAGVRVSDSRLTVELTDGREVSIPLTEFPELAAATPGQRANWTITALGTAIYWPDIDEEAALAGMLGISESALEEAAGFKTYDEVPDQLRRVIPVIVELQRAQTRASAVKYSTVDTVESDWTLVVASPASKPSPRLAKEGPMRTLPVAPHAVALATP